MNRCFRRGPGRYSPGRTLSDPPSNNSAGRHRAGRQDAKQFVVLRRQTKVGQLSQRLGNDAVRLAVAKNWHELRPGATFVNRLPESSRLPHSRPVRCRAAGRRALLIGRGASREHERRRLLELSLHPHRPVFRRRGIESIQQSTRSARNRFAQSSTHWRCSGESWLASYS